VARTRDDDACPSALQAYQAADGAVVRIRVPGGMITAAKLAALAATAKRFGSSALELTSRGNIQIRGIADPGPVAEAVAAAGLLPSATHERARNIVASPLSGRTGGRPDNSAGRSGGLADVRGWVAELDAAIQASPELAGLPGRFWFGIDDGRGDISGLGTDVGVHVLSADDEGQVLDDGCALMVAGRDTGLRIGPAQAAETMVAVAERFVRTRGKAWRIAELADTAVLLPTSPVAEAGGTWPPTLTAPVGWIGQNDGRVALGAAVRLGMLEAHVAEYLAAAEAPLVITPWRSVLVCDLDEGVADLALRVLAPLGLVFDENSPWLSVSACTGKPGCERAAADVRADAAAAVESARGLHRHFVGCERACGSPPGAEVLVATGDGYRPRVSRP
jgi:precorrin-3B synthase